MADETNVNDQQSNESTNTEPAGASAGGGDSKASNNANNSNQNSTAELDKLVQARADKLTAEIGKKNAALQKELDTLKKEKMTAEELKQLEISEKEKILAEREKMLHDKENRIFAIKAIKEAGLDDGSNKSLELVDFVMADTGDAINKKVKAFGDLVKKFVAAEVDKTFKQNGRNPNGGNANGSAGNGDKNNSVAESLGKARAEKQKQSNDILKYYGGGK